MGNQIQHSSFFIVILVLCAGFHECHSIPWERWGIKISNFLFGTKPNWWNLQFKAGDIIHCGIITPFPYHVLLATSSSTVAHMMGSSRSGTLREESWSNFHSWASPQMEHCWIDTKATLPDAVERARNDIEFFNHEKIYYNFFMCNCEHWVRYWAHGAAYSRQSRKGTDSKCDIGRDRTKVTLFRYPDGRHDDHGPFDGELVFNVVKCHSLPLFSWNNHVSKIVLGGLCVRIWDNRECSGRSICLCQSENDLSLRMKAPGISWDNAISSVSLCGYNEEIKTIAYLFEDRNYQGANRKMALRKYECVSFFENDWWNDEVTSVQVTYGCLEYFTGFYCSGISYELSANESYVGEGFDDQISSIRPC